MVAIVCRLHSCIKLTKWKTATTNDNKMRQEDSNIEYRKKGKHSTKNPIPTQELKSKPNAFKMFT